MYVSTGISMFDHQFLIATPAIVLATLRQPTQELLATQQQQPVGQQPLQQHATQTQPQLPHPPQPQSIRNVGVTSIAGVAGVITDVAVDVDDPRPTFGRPTKKRKREEIKCEEPKVAENIKQATQEVMNKNKVTDLIRELQKITPAPAPTPTPTQSIPTLGKQIKQRKQQCDVCGFYYFAKCKKCKKINKLRVGKKHQQQQQQQQQQYWDACNRLSDDNNRNKMFQDILGVNELLSS